MFKSRQKETSRESDEDTKEKEKDLSKHLVAGLAAYKRQDWDEAVSCFSAAIALGRRHLGAYTNRSMAYLKLNQIEEAYHDAQTAVEIDPSYGKAHLRLAQVYCAQGDLYRAEQEIRIAIKLEPSGECMRVKEEILTEKKKKSTLT